MVIECGSNSQKLSYFSFIWTTFLLTSAGPFGFEYSVMAVGVGYTLLLIALFSIFYAFPIALISSELAGLMPSRHGQIIWAYRSFHKLNTSIGDFIGYLNASNVIIFWILNTAVTPIILINYLMTISGPLSTAAIYCIQLAIIISGLILNTFNFSVITSITSLLCIVMIIPLFISFFWTLPDIEPSTQWIACSTNWPLAITTCIWEFSGFESLGNIINEIGFETKRIYSAFCIAIFADVIILVMPTISSATLAGNNCSDWYSGFYAVSSGRLALSLEYSIAIGSVLINWCIYVIAVGIVSRMIWGAAQPYFEVQTDGRMVISDGRQGDMTGHNQIAINIFPQRFIGEVWQRTGSPIYAVIIVTLIVALTNIYLDFDDLVEFNLFTYFVYFGIEIFAFLILKHVEPNAPRTFEIPFGKIGAWVTAMIVLSSLGVAFFVLVIDDATLFGYAVAMNGVLVCYYFVGKRFFNRMHQDNILPNVAKFDEDESYSDEMVFGNEIQPLI